MKTFRFLILGLLLVGGCAVEGDGGDDEALAEPAPAAATVHTAPAPAPAPAPAATCHRTTDCPSNAFFCCNHRCIRPVPGIRCLNQGGGVDE